MPVDPCTFIKPAVALRGIHPNQHHVSAARNHKVSHIETERIVPPAMTPQVESIQHHHRLAIRTVKFQRHSLANVFRRKLKYTPIPTNARRGIVPAEWVKSL